MDWGVSFCFYIETSAYVNCIVILPKFSGDIFQNSAKNINLLLTLCFIYVTILLPMRKLGDSSCYYISADKLV